jgi:hypothetical protein
MKALKTSAFRLGRLTTVGAGGTFLVALLIAAAPATAAMSANTTLHKPYKNLPESASVSLDLSGCATAKTTKNPDWNYKTGVFTMAGLSNAPACKIHSGQESLSEWDGSWNTQGPFNWKTTGNHSLYATFKADLSTSNSISSFGCNLAYKAALSECDAWSYTYAEVGLTVYNSNFSTYLSSYSTLAFNSSSQDNYSQRSCTPVCTLSGGNFSSGANGASTTKSLMTVYQNLTGTYAVTNVNQTYYYYFVILAFTITEAYTIDATSTSPVTASASINMATAGNGFDLVNLGFA